MKLAFAALALLTASAAITGSAFTLQPVTLTIPAGFDGPIRQERSGAITVAFTKSGSGANKTLLQVTLYDVGQELKKMSDEERATAPSKYLLEFVGGVERRRTHFKRTDPSPLQIGGVAAAKLQWTGQLQAVDTIGVMYCFVAGTKVISFHTQDLGSTPTAGMIEAIRAFEQAKVKRAD